MIDLLNTIGLDYILFLIVSLACVGAVHVWLRRWCRVRRFPSLLWVMAGLVLVPGFLLVRAQDNQVRAQPGLIADDVTDEQAVAASRRRIGVIVLLASLEAGLVTCVGLMTLLQAEVTKRRRVLHRLRKYRQQIREQAKHSSEDLLDAQRQALQSEKLASLGQLAAGVAHEINTPIQYVGDNLRAISDFVRDLVRLTDQYRELAQVVKASGLADDVIGRVERAEQDCDLEYIRDDAPKAVAQGLEGVQRVAHIVRAMKDFSHLDQGQVELVDVNRALARTLTVTRNEYKYVADVETDFTDLPEIEAYGSELNQVFLNIIVNAAHAIADTNRRGTIKIRTQRLGERVEVAISDTGNGIPQAIRAKVYDPFFTTKPVGKGTGQGLNIAHQIVGKHGGTIHFETEEGRGTTFFIRLPVKLAKTGKGEGLEAKVQGPA